MAEMTCTFTDEKGRCQEMAIGGFTHMKLKKCGFYCERHVNNQRLKANVKYGNVRIVSLEEAIVIEVMNS